MLLLTPSNAVGLQNPHEVDFAQTLSVDTEQ